MVCNCCQVWKKRFNHIKMQINMIEEADKEYTQGRWMCEK